MKTFRIEWIKEDSGGGIEDFMANDILSCLQSFYEYWGDLGITRRVLSICEVKSEQ